MSGPSCIYARVSVGNGRVVYLQDDIRVPAPGQFAIFLPPFTVVQAWLERCAVETSAIAFRPPSGRALPSEPLLFTADADHAPASIPDVLRRMDRARQSMAIGRARRPSPMASRAKTLLDAGYGGRLAIGGIAARLRVPPAVLSRAFKLTYGMPPVRYRHHLRIMDALLRFAEGGVPAAVCQDVGFDDLSRFYKVLRQVACAPPGRYRPVRSKNAKT